MKSTTKMVLLAIGSIFGSITGGYLAAVADISISLTGSDLTGLAGINYIDPGRISMAGKLVPLIIHMALGIGLSVFAIFTLLKVRRGGNFFREGEKFSIISLVTGLSIAGIALLAVSIAPEIEPEQKWMMFICLAVLMPMLLAKVVKIFTIKRPG